MGAPRTLDARASVAWLRRFARTTPGVVAVIAVAVSAGCVIAGLFALVRKSMTTTERERYIDTVVSMICDNVEPKPAQSPRGRAKKSASS